MAAPATTRPPATSETDAADILPLQRHLFDIPRDIVWLNCAYMGPLPRAAADAGTEGLRRKLRPWSIEVDDFFDASEALRSAWAALLGAGGEDLALTPSASYGITLAARSLPLGPGDEILVAEDQFPSNYYPWTARAASAGASVRVVARPADGDWTRAVLDALDARVAVAALPQVHWTDGGRFDLERIGAAVRDCGAALVVDATQSLGAMPFDVGRIRPDFVAGAGYKWLLGPYSLGYLYVAPHRLDAEPLEHNWIQRENAREFARLVDYTERPQPGARRFDVGERSNFALVPAALRAAQQLLAWSPEAVARSLRPKTRRLAREAERLGCRVGPEAFRAPHYLALGLPPGGGAGALERVREALSAHSVFVSIRGDSVRVTPHLYNDDEDLDRFLEALRSSL